MATNRRSFFLGSSAAALGVLAAPSLGVRRTRAAEQLTAVQWGGNYIKVSKEIVAEKPNLDVTWELHAGGAAAILGKVKAAWPNVKYDTVAAWDPSSSR
jgi:putative spermidine/putrescine transport system substrate-binding protein